jgi:hypothetical protein
MRYLHPSAVIRKRKYIYKYLAQEAYKLYHISTNLKGKEVKYMNIPFMKHVAWYLVIAMFIIGIAPRVDAGLVGSEITPLMQIDRTTELEKIQNFLETKAVSKRLGQFGYTQEEIQKRLTQLNDQQIHQIATKLDDLKIGGDGGGVIIAILVIIILVIVILQLTGHKVIVT